MLHPSAEPTALAALRELLAAPKRCALITHYNPDGDAMGSSLGLAGVLRAAGHTAHVVLPNTPPPNLQWMPGHADVIAGDTDREAAVRALGEAEVVFCLDFNKPDRVGPLEEALRAASFKVLIDHHRDPDPMAAITFSDTTACATAQMVYDIAAALGLEQHLSADLATCLLTGLITDSGSFRFSSTTPHTLRVAAALMERGAIPDRIHQAVMDDNSESRMRLKGFTLSERMEVLHEQGTVIMHLTEKDLQRFDFQPGDTEGFVNMGLGIRGIRLSAFFIQRGDLVKVSLRSKGALAVNGFLAQHFQGGGHANAAGGHLRASVGSAIELFRRELPALLSAHPA